MVQKEAKNDTKALIKPESVNTAKNIAATKPPEEAKAKPILIDTSGAKKENNAKSQLI